MTKAGDLGIGGGRNNVLGLQLGLVGIGAAGNDLGGIGVANAGQRLELIRGGGVQVNQLAGGVAAVAVAGLAAGLVCAVAGRTLKSEAAASVRTAAVKRVNFMYFSFACIGAGEL